MTWQCKICKEEREDEEFKTYDSVVRILYGDICDSCRNEFISWLKDNHQKKYEKWYYKNNYFDLTGSKKLREEIKKGVEL